jgi:hypothetical protein
MKEKLKDIGCAIDEIILIFVRLLRVLRVSVVHNLIEEDRSEHTD